MRLPIGKVYRAFPELDRFDDQRCGRLLAHIQRRRSVVLNAIPAAAALLGLGVATLLLLLLRTVHWPERLREMWHLGPYGLGLKASVLALLVGVVILPPVITRDVILRRLLRGHIRSAKCPTCKYSLLGLTCSDGVVKCPECGVWLHLDEMGLVPEDLACQKAEP